MTRTIQSLQHPLVKHLVKLRQDRSYRHEHAAVIVEGIKPVSELCQTLKPINLISTSPYHDAIVVSEEVMRKISGMENPEGLLGEFPMPSLSSMQKVRFLVALDGVSDPGNMGTLIRTALALGWEGVFILNNSCDPFNDKAIRAARGATFRVPISLGGWKELQELAKRNELRPLVADLAGIAPEKCDSQEAKLLVMGNEAHGASQEALDFCQRVTIPMPGNMESLNVAIAGGILLYLLRKT